MIIDESELDQACVLDRVAESEIDSDDECNEHVEVVITKRNVQFDNRVEYDDGTVEVGEPQNNVNTGVQIHDQTNDVEVDEAEIADDTVELSDSMSEGSVSELDGTVISEVVETEESTSYETDMSGSETNGSTSSYDSAAESPPPPRPDTLRRSARNIVPPTVFTYNKIGGEPELVHRCARSKK